MRRKDRTQCFRQGMRRRPVLVLGRSQRSWFSARRGLSGTCRRIRVWLTRMQRCSRSTLLQVSADTSPTRSPAYSAIHTAKALGSVCWLSAASMRYCSPRSSTRECAFLRGKHHLCAGVALGPAVDQRLLERKIHKAVDIVQKISPKCRLAAAAARHAAKKRKIPAAVPRRAPPGEAAPAAAGYTRGPDSGNSHRSILLPDLPAGESFRSSKAATRHSCFPGSCRSYGVVIRSCAKPFRFLSPRRAAYTNKSLNCKLEPCANCLFLRFDEKIVAKCRFF